MPQTAAFLDALRDAFGAAGIDAEIAAGMRGEPDRFYAREGEHVIGTPFSQDGLAVLVVAADRHQRRA
jgi:hypothetical protein